MQQQAAPTAAISNQAPIPMECDAPFLKGQGELPRELNGTLYRNGPNPQFDAPGAQWFVGDGLLRDLHLVARCTDTLSPRLPRTASSPTLTSFFMPGDCSRSRKATCRPKSSRARFRGAA